MSLSLVFHQPLLSQAQEASNKNVAELENLRATVAATTTATIATMGKLKTMEAEKAEALRLITTERDSLQSELGGTNAMIAFHSHANQQLTTSVADNLSHSSVLHRSLSVYFSLSQSFYLFSLSQTNKRWSIIWKPRYLPCRRNRSD